MADSPRLSVVIIAKNEATLLPDCLTSVHWADEIVLLDSGSTDNTRDIAREFGARVFRSDEWHGYGKQRQRAQSHATGDIILMIDADERVTPALRQEIEQILKNPDPDTVYSLPRSNLFLGRFMRHSGWAPDRVLRLYPHHYQYNDDQVHESVNTENARIVSLSGALEHLTCLDFTAFQRKQLAYAEAWAQQRAQQGKRCGLSAIFSHTLGALIKTLILRAGFLDGKQGWLLAMVNMQYTFNKYAALWALNQTKKG